MTKNESVKLAESAVIFSRTLCDIAEFLFFINKTPEQRELLIQSQNKLSWDVRIYNKLVSEIEHDDGTASQS